MWSRQGSFVSVVLFLLGGASLLTLGGAKGPMSVDEVLNAMGAPRTPGTPEAQPTPKPPSGLEAVLQGLEAPSGMEALLRGLQVPKGAPMKKR